MTQISRRSFLKQISTLPFYKVAWPHKNLAEWHLTQEQGLPNILFLIFDTLSARHVTLHGYQRETTPNLARFAERTTVFHNHRAAANFTSPGTASMLTGTYPWSHRAFHLHGIVDESYLTRSIFTLLPDNYYKVAYTHNLLVTSLLHQFRGSLDLFKQTRELCLSDGEIADRLFLDDYSVAFWAEWLALRGGSTPPGSLFMSVVDRARRFVNKREITQEYGELFPKGIPNLHSLFFVLEDAVDWVQAQVNSLPSPFFGYIHLLPPHEPYLTRRDFVNVFDDDWKPVRKEPGFGSEDHPQAFLNRQRQAYDEFLAYTDAEFGRLYDSLERSGALDNCYLVLTSDHGELFERGIRGHVTPTLYEPLLHVPLLIAKPGQKSRVDVYERTSCVDLLPTFLHVTRQPIPDWSEGMVLPTFGVDSNFDKRRIYALEAKSNHKQAPFTKATLAIVNDRYKLIHYLEAKDENRAYELYDLVNDPEELNDLYSSEKSIATALKDELHAKLEKVNQSYHHR